MAAPLTYSQLLPILRQAGFSGVRLYLAAAVAAAESSLHPDSTNTAGNSAGTDRGIFQINSYYHSEVSDACAFDPQCAAKEAFRISSGGTNWSQWSAYKNGSYLQDYTQLLSGAGQSLTDGQITGAPAAAAVTGNGFSGAPDPCGSTDCSIKNLPGCATLFSCRAKEGATWLLTNVGILAVAGIGVYLLFRPQINQAASTAVKEAILA